MQLYIIYDASVQALHSIAENRLRAMLSVLGIALGIAAVMAVGTASEAIKKYVFSELETYGLKSIWIYRKWENENPNRSVRQGSGISNEDFGNIQKGCCPAIARATPSVFVNETTSVSAGSSFFDAVIEGIGVEYLGINNDRLMSGRNFRSDEVSRRKNVAIIAPKVAEGLFGRSGRYLGRSFRLFDQKFTVIGLLDNKNRDLLANLGVDTYDVNGRILVPYTVYQTYLGSKDIHTLQAEAVSMAKTRDAVDQLEGLLNRSHSSKFEYVKETMEEWIQQAEYWRYSITAGGLGAAFIILLVGGMGVMNIMSTSVIERTREIGIRKAMGAQYSDILAQFLLESVYVTSVGGVIGLLLGVGVIYATGLFIGYPIHPSWYMALVALLVSMLVGIVSGYYPAHRAATMKPVDALRYE
ncbi:MAG: ABC transporter permease [Gammaproteobacteria bacterium]|nr:ABC transporter permease [Gammaproteobacteria bacterium]MDH5801341.1 ABC transporter permease [Gammaproteobacteria bacterium]